MNRTTFPKRMYGIRKAGPRSVPRAVRLLPVHVGESAPPDRMISVNLGGGLGLRFAPGTDPAYLAARIDMLLPC